MPHSRDLTWAQAQAIAEVSCRALINALNQGKEAYNDLLEALESRTDSQMAEQLFQTATPTQEQIDKVADLRASMVEANALYTGANLNTLRRMV